jgi:hypothetical protein
VEARLAVVFAVMEVFMVFIPGAKSKGGELAVEVNSGSWES